MNDEYYILMADIIGSQEANQKLLMADFEDIVKQINKSHAKSFLSPLTITLGDEFQSVLKDLPNSLLIILAIEELIIKNYKSFKLRYALVEGTIDTPINPNIAYGMLGDGLTRARKKIELTKKSNSRFEFEINDKKKSEALNHLFFSLQNLLDAWDIKKDFKLVNSFLAHQDYKTVAKLLIKEPSLMWKRKKSLKIDIYQSLKQVSYYIGGLKDD